MSTIEVVAYVLAISLVTAAAASFWTYGLVLRAYRPFRPLTIRQLLHQRWPRKTICSAIINTRNSADGVIVPGGVFRCISPVTHGPGHFHPRVGVWFWDDRQKTSDSAHWEDRGMP